MKPKLLVALNYFYPYVSGLSEYARHVAGALRDDFEVTILTGRHAARLPEEEMIDGMRVVRAGTLLHLHKGYLSLDLVLRFIRLAANSDIIHLHLPMLEAALLTHIGRKYAPILITYHCDVIPAGGLMDWLAVKSVLLSARAAVKRANAVVVLTKDYARGSPVLAELDDKLIEIPPISKMEHRTLQASSRTDESYIIGFVGRFVVEKGINVVLDAVGPVIERLPNARFLLVGETQEIVGGGVYGITAEKLMRHGRYLKLLGRVSDDELWKIYNTLDVLLLPSINSYEAFGLVQIEAMLAGALVIASDMRGVRVPITLTGNGLLVAPGCVHSLVEAIIACHSLRREQSRNQVRSQTLQQFCNRIARERYVLAMGSLIESWRKPDALSGH